MKPLQTPLNKAPNQGERKNPNKNPSVSQKSKTQILEKNKLCFRAQTSSKKHI